MKDKKTLRREMKAVRAAVEGRAAADRAIGEALLALPEVAAAKSLFVYKSFGTEADTGAILAALCGAGKEVFLPRVENGEMVAVRYTGQPLARGAFGIEEPCGEPFAGAPDVCIAPLLAADGQFRRLGYGGGYYDRYFAREGRGAFKIGICYDVQLIKTIPAEAHDARLDVIVTDKRVLRREKAEEQ